MAIAGNNTACSATAGTSIRAAAITITLSQIRAGLRTLPWRSVRAVAEPVLAGGLDGPLDARAALAVEQARDVRSALIAAAQITEQFSELGIGRPVRSIGLVCIHGCDRSPQAAV